MTDKLHCPICDTELETMFGISESVLGCPKCKHIATIGIWEALMDGKKAQDALKIVEDKLQQIHLGVETSIDPRSHAMTLVVIQSIASDALKIIAPITKQDTKE